MIVAQEAFSGPPQKASVEQPSDPLDGLVRLDMTGAIRYYIE